MSSRWLHQDQRHGSKYIVSLKVSHKRDAFDTIAVTDYDAVSTIKITFFSAECHSNLSECSAQFSFVYPVAIADFPHCDIDNFTNPIADLHN